MQAIMEAYAESGQTQSVFCAARGINLATFQYWRRRGEKESCGSSGFVHVQVPESEMQAEVEVKYGGVCIRLSGSNMSYVVELVRQLAGAC